MRTRVDRTLRLLIVLNLAVVAILAGTMVLDWMRVIPARNTAAESVPPEATPVPSSEGARPVVMMRAVIEQTITVSMKGSSIATKPWVSGSRVLTTEWAIEDEPIPASFEKAARRKPSTTTPRTPPVAPFGVNASATMRWSASGSWAAFAAMTRNPQPR